MSSFFVKRKWTLPSPPVSTSEPENFMSLPIPPADPESCLRECVFSIHELDALDGPMVPLVPPDVPEGFRTPPQMSCLKFLPCSVLRTWFPFVTHVLVILNSRVVFPILSSILFPCPVPHSALCFHSFVFPCLYLCKTHAFCLFGFLVAPHSTYFVLVSCLSLQFSTYTSLFVTLCVNASPCYGPCHLTCQRLWPCPELLPPVFCQPGSLLSLRSWSCLAPL